MVRLINILQFNIIQTRFLLFSMGRIRETVNKWIFFDFNQNNPPQILQVTY